jgi:hypothetical protein
MTVKTNENLAARASGANASRRESASPELKVRQEVMQGGSLTKEVPKHVVQVWKAIPGTEADHPREAETQAAIEA